MKKGLLVILVILLIAAQFFQPPKNESTGESIHDISAVMAIPADIDTLLKRSCYDCHSNNTIYPWFDRISPISWWVNGHVKEGKIELNFSEFGNYSKRKRLHKLKEIRESIEKDEMPLQSYVLLHRSAGLNDEQKSKLIEWTREAALVLEAQN